MLFKFFSKKRESQSKIGILYICTGRYHIFWDGFYKSARKYFCKGAEVHYFVFTEHPINRYNNPYVHHIFQSRLGWPFDTLKRFHLFLEQREKLEQMDYLYFFNANMLFKSSVTEKEILPDEEGNGLVSVIHPCYYHHQSIAPFEDNKDSVAYVDATKEMDYFQGCLSGGRTKEYLFMAEMIKQLIDADLKKSIIGKWWDESYMNLFFRSNPPKKLPPSFAYPESLPIPFKKIIVQLDKNKKGGYNYLRNIETD